MTHGNVESLRELTLQILDPEQPAPTLRPEVLALAEILRAQASFQIDPQRDIGAGETRAEAGLALSPTMAAMCLDEYHRTAVFIRGLHEAIRGAGRPVSVLYAGCGPYALLAVPQMSVFTPEQARFTLLDIHRESVDSAMSVVDSFGFSGHVSSCHVADASSYVIDPDHRPDIILSETMNAALENEPQVAIARHLFRQAPAATLVPESVRVDAVLVDQSKEFPGLEHDGPGSAPLEQDRVRLGTVFELNAPSIDSWASELGNELPAASIRIEQAPALRYSAMLLTTVTVHGRNVLRDYDSSLTIPRPLVTEGSLERGATLRFHYRLGDAPALVCTALPP